MLTVITSIKIKNYPILGIKLNQSILDDNLKELDFEKILKIKDLIFKNISVYQANPNVFDYIKKN